MSGETSLNCLSAECSIESRFRPDGKENAAAIVSIAFRLNARLKEASTIFNMDYDALVSIAFRLNARLKVALISFVYNLGLPKSQLPFG